MDRWIVSLTTILPLAMNEETVIGIGPFTSEKEADAYKPPSYTLYDLLYIHRVEAPSGIIATGNEKWYMLLWDSSDGSFHVTYDAKAFGPFDNEEVADLWSQNKKECQQRNASWCYVRVIPPT